jgi:FkbM family methyltransferase
MIEEFKEFIYDNEHLQKSQLRQDLFVLFITKLKRDGFFVEFGACDGVELSNTLTLEKDFNWKGILAEPSISWHDELFNNRSCHIDKRAVWKESNEELYFVEVENVKTISGIDTELFKTNFTDLRESVHNKKFKVKTITLKDLLIEYNTPKQIDYLSIDTEGTEFEIISGFDFNEYDIKIITVEHFFNVKEKNKIYDYLKQFNYERVLTELSGQDDWYVKK